MIEILAPCGNEESFYAAVNNGATAVYLGMSDFSARRNAANFTKENISYFVSYAHAVGVRVYVALNTLVKDEELLNFFETAKVVYEAGADAFIIQDVFMGKTLRSYFPDIELHLSTQAGINDVYGARFAKENSFDRVILARETGEDEIREISKFIDVEIFAHGALCTCFSGHCYMSSFIGGNSGNRGLCKQPCRQKYFLETKDKWGYHISLSDLALIDRVKDIENLGVKSIKIEGRMRSPEYVALSARAYRRAVEGKSYTLDEVKRAYNRGDFTEGYTFGLDDKIISDKVQGNIGFSVGKLTRKNKTYIIEGKESFSEGDAFKILRDGYEVGSAVCLRDGKEIQVRGEVKAGDEVRITKDVTLKDELIKNKRYKNLSVTAKFIVGERAELSCDGVVVYSDEPLIKAITSGLTEKELKDNLNKTDKYPFRVLSLSSTIVGEPFIPKSKLNKMRSDLYEKIFSKDIKHCKIADFKRDYSYNFNFDFSDVYLIDDLTRDLNSDKDFAIVYSPLNYKKIDVVSLNKAREKSPVFLYVPAFTNKIQSNEIKSLLGFFDGIYADGINGIGLASELGIKYIVGSGLNVFNSLDLSVLSNMGNCVPVLSQEISKNQLASFREDCGYLFTKGSIRLMELIYCPFGKKCSSCKRDFTFSMKDEKGYSFKIRRYILGGRCVFEIYNEAYLSIPQANRNFYNLIGVGKAEFEKLKSGETGIKITCGNYKRGVL